jgi:hypothetical protein
MPLTTTPVTNRLRERMDDRSPVAAAEPSLGVSTRTNPPRGLGLSVSQPALHGTRMFGRNTPTHTGARGGAAGFGAAAAEVATASAKHVPRRRIGLV